MDGGTFGLTYPVCPCKNNILFWKSNVNTFFLDQTYRFALWIFCFKDMIWTERGINFRKCYKGSRGLFSPFFLQNQWNSSFEKVLAGDFCGRNLCVAVGSFYYRVDVFICEFSEWSLRGVRGAAVGPRGRPFSVRAQSRPPERVQGEP